MLHKVRRYHKQSPQEDDALTQEIAIYCHGSVADSWNSQQTLEEMGAEGLVPLGHALIDEGISPFVPSLLKDIRRAGSVVGRILLAIGLIALVTFVQRWLGAYFNPVSSWWVIVLGSLALYAALGGTLRLLFGTEDWANIWTTSSFFGSRSVRPLLLKALDRTLTSEPDCVSGPQQDLLNQLLKTIIQRSDEELALRILRVMEHKGSREAISSVAWVIHRPLTHPRDRVIRRAAEATLLALQERAKAQQMADTYLRPSSRPIETAADGLLRPAHAVGPAEEKALLRASVTDKDGSPTTYTSS